MSRGRFTTLPGGNVTGELAGARMRLTLPSLNLMAKLIALMVMLLALRLGAEVVISIRAQDAIAKTTERKVRDLASVIQISVQELSSVAATDRDRLQSFVANLHTNGLEVSIASNKELIINSSNPKLIGAALNPEVVRAMMELRSRNPGEPVAVPGVKLGLADRESTVYFIPVEVEDHVLGYVQVVANFSDFDEPLRDYRWRLVTFGIAIFALGLVLSYVLAERYVEPIHAVADAAQNIDARGLEPVPEAPRRDEIGLLTRSFNGMLAQLRRAREREQELNRLERFTALGQLAGALAHEIKNPLNFISLALDRLRARYAPQAIGREDFLHQIAIMKEEIKRLSEMVQTFLHYGQPIEIHPAPTDLRQLIDGVLALSESRLKSQGIEVVERGDDGHITLNVDAEKLRTCFVNVVVNATQAMPEGGQLMVDYARNNGNLVVTFADTGAGIDAEIASRVFEPFFTTKREGIGLGLFFSKAIVEKHGGTIEIGPKDPPPGAKVTFTFPLSGINKTA
jgi:signal transduction histidine kinase